MALVDLETFKGHSYPDVLVSILIQTLKAYKKWLDTSAVFPASKTSFWVRLFGRQPVAKSHDKARAAELAKQAQGLIETLDTLLMTPDESQRTQTSTARSSSEDSAELGVSFGTDNVGAKLGARGAQSEENTLETADTYQSKKIEFLHRRIIELRSFFEGLSELTNGPTFLLLDDVYHIRPQDQPYVIDYFHRIAKGTNVWLKIGTIRHRTRWYIPGRPPVGMKLGDDADQIDLDVTLEKYELTKRFLLKILGQFCDEVGVKLADILSDGARDRLVLASGGVARDFLTLIRNSIDVARQRLAVGDDFRGIRISAEDVNKAAGEFDSSKREDLMKDTAAGESDKILEFFDDVREFCLQKTEANCFLIEKDTDAEEADRIKELVDLKFVHHVRSRVTVREKPGKIFDGYMLDISQYSGERKRRDFEMIGFWERDGEEQLRKRKLIFA